MASTRAPATTALTRLSASTPRAAARAQRSFGAWTKATAMGVAVGRRTVPALAAAVGRAARPVGPVGAFEARRWDSGGQPPQEQAEPKKKQKQAMSEKELAPSKIYNFEDVQKLVDMAEPFAENREEYLEDSSKPLLIDVRSPAEYAAGAIPSAVNIPVTSAPDAIFAQPEDWEDKFGFPKPDVQRELVFYCKAGVRSRAAATLAKQAGYQSVGEYPGSWLDWERHGEQAAEE